MRFVDTSTHTASGAYSNVFTSNICLGFRDTSIWVPHLIPNVRYMPRWRYLWYDFIPGCSCRKSEVVVIPGPITAPRFQPYRLLLRRFDSGGNPSLEASASIILSTLCSTAIISFPFLSLTLHLVRLQPLHAFTCALSTQTFISCNEAPYSFPIQPSPQYPASSCPASTRICSYHWHRSSSFAAPSPHRLFKNGCEGHEFVIQCAAGL